MPIHKDASFPSPERMSSIQLPHLHHLLGFLKRLRTVGNKLWKLGIRQVLFLRNFFRGCLSLFIGNLNQISSGSRPLSWEKANRDSHDVSNNVDSFSRFLPSFRLLTRWSRSQSLPRYCTKDDCHPELQTGPSTSQAVVPYSITPTDIMRMSPVTSVSTRPKSDHTRDSHLPPGPSKEIEKLIGITSEEFERYNRNFKSYVFDHRSPVMQSWIYLFDIVRNVATILL